MFCLEDYYLTSQDSDDGDNGLSDSVTVTVITPQNLVAGWGQQEHLPLSFSSKPFTWHQIFVSTGAATAGQSTCCTNYRHKTSETNAYLFVLEV